VEMLKKSGSTPDELIKMVASPGGTTQAAINKLLDSNYSENIINAMIACTNRADELSR
jgi:pyrroline-5-carboxylate reductase